MKKQWKEPKFVVQYFPIGIRKCSFLMLLRMVMRSWKTMDLRNVYGKTTNLLGDIIIILQMYLIIPKCIITI